MNVANQPATSAQATKWSIVGTEDFVPQQTGNQNVLRILEDDRPLPSNLDFQTTFNVDPENGSGWSNALLVFDYKSSTDFKFAGAFVGVNELAIGRMTNQGYVLDRIVSQQMENGTDYQLDVRIDSNTVTLMLDGIEQLQETLADGLQDGELGLSTWNNTAQFTNVLLKEV